MTVIRCRLSLADDGILIVLTRDIVDETAQKIAEKDGQVETAATVGTIVATVETERDEEMVTGMMIAGTMTVATMTVATEDMIIVGAATGTDMNEMTETTEMIDIDPTTRMTYQTGNKEESERENESENVTNGPLLDVLDPLVAHKLLNETLTPMTRTTTILQKLPNDPKSIP